MESEKCRVSSDQWKRGRKRKRDEPPRREGRQGNAEEERRMGNHETSEVAGWMPETSCLRLRVRARKSHSTWMPCQKVSDWPKKAPKRMDMDGVMERLPSTISLIARGGTPMARAMAFWEIPMGWRYSSRRISPGVMECFMAVTYGVMGGRQW